ncbi:hypothetical protein C8R47DRAFT_1217289 [Mycena vitilis]|nr:hypothetical protein C8R47DRAFT_1217289 [Mycena vitilis]
MTAMTRNMRKTAGLPDLPAHFPLDVPRIATRPTANKASRSKPVPAVVPKSTLRIVSPVVLSSPSRFDPPSPLTSLASSRSAQSSFRSHAGSYSTRDSTPTRYDPSLSEMHPGVRRLQGQPEAKWNVVEDGQSLRICGPPPRDPRSLRSRALLFGREWGLLSPTPSREGSLAGSEFSSEATVRGTPSVSSKVSTVVELPRRELRVAHKRRGVSKQ